MLKKIKAEISIILKSCGELVNTRGDDEPWVFSNPLEKILQSAIRANRDLNEVNVVLTEEIADFGRNFHTVIRKYFDDTSSSFLYNCISDYGHLWTMTLYELSRVNNGKSHIQNLPGAFNIVERGISSRWGLLETEAAWEFFFLKHTVEEMEKLWMEIFGQ